MHSSIIIETWRNDFNVRELLMFFLASIDDFARMYSSKLGIKEGILKKTLWGDYYLHAKSKRILGGAQAKAKKPLFVQFVLENLWAVYDALVRRSVLLASVARSKSLRRIPFKVRAILAKIIY